MRAVFVFGAIACATFPAAARAQDSAGDPKLGRQVLRDFANCAVRSERNLAQQLVLAAPASAMQVSDLKKVLDPGCFGFWRGGFRASDLAIRGTFAEELVRKDLKRRWPVLDASGLSPLDWSVPEVQKYVGEGKVDPAVLKKAHEHLLVDARVGSLGECVVRKSPSGAVAVLNEKPESAAEIAAMKALTAEIAGCIKAGESSAFSRTSLRYALALSYYRLANAAALPLRWEAAK